jgi:hypothetical protein
MAIAASSIIQRVVGLLVDVTSVRWKIDELVRYLNDGQREVVIYRPDAKVVTASHALSAGTKQTIPTEGRKLIEVLRNTGGGAITLIDRQILDAQDPSWHTITGTTNILHYMSDVRTPTVFLVYPPAAASGASVELSYSAYPTDIAEPGAGSTFSDVSGNIDVLDIFSNVLQDYILYRAYLKDGEFAGNAQRATAYYSAFANALGIEIKSAVTVSPNKSASATAVE